MKPEMSIVKIGGALLESKETLRAFCLSFAALPGQKLLVHGGGKKASTLGQQLGHPARMFEGRRITDDLTLEIALMVYAGWANKTLVAELQALGCQALGLSGADADIIRAGKRPPGKVDFGWVGDIQRVDGARLSAFLELGLVPVLCALTHDGHGQMLNTNADTIAAEIAVALSPDMDCTLMYCFDKAGVLTDIDDPGSLLPSLDRATCEQMREEGTIATGMLPKLHNGFEALRQGVLRVRVGAPEMLRPDCSTYTELHL